MCVGCWEKAGKPIIDNRQVHRAAKACSAVYEHSCVGGNLHIILDDWNVEDGNLAFCADYVKVNPHDYPAEQLEYERHCLEALRPLSVDERYSALALMEGFWSVLQ